MGDGDKPAGGAGLKWGCATALLVGAPLGFGALGLAALGHCTPGTTCPTDAQLFGGAFLIAALCGLAVGAAIDRLRRRD